MTLYPTVAPARPDAESDATFAAALAQRLDLLAARRDTALLREDADAVGHYEDRIIRCEALLGQLALWRTARMACREQVARAQAARAQAALAASRAGTRYPEGAA